MSSSPAPYRDYNLVLGTVLLYAVFVILMNSGLQVWLNPKLRFE